MKLLALLALAAATLAAAESTAGPIPVDADGVWRPFGFQGVGASSDEHFSLVVPAGGAHVTVQDAFCVGDAFAIVWNGMKRGETSDVRDPVTGQRITATCDANVADPDAAAKDPRYSKGCANIPADPAGNAGVLHFVPHLSPFYSGAAFFKVSEGPCPEDAAPAPTTPSERFFVAKSGGYVATRDEAKAVCHSAGASVRLAELVQATWKDAAAAVRATSGLDLPKDKFHIASWDGNPYSGYEMAWTVIRNPASDDEGASYNPIDTSSPPPRYALCERTDVASSSSQTPQDVTATTISSGTVNGLSVVGPAGPYWAYDRVCSAAGANKEPAVLSAWRSAEHAEAAELALRAAGEENVRAGDVWVAGWEVRNNLPMMLRAGPAGGTMGAIAPPEDLSANKYYLCKDVGTSPVRRSEL